MKRTPLTRKTRLTARKGLARTGMRRGPTARLAASRRVYADTRAVVFDRDQGKCAVCASPHALQVHHRTPRGMGGSSRNADIHSPANCVLLCAQCHLWAESRRELAFRLGYLVARWDDCLTRPVLTALRGWILLDDSGGWKAAVDPTEPVGRTATGDQG